MQDRREIFCKALLANLSDNKFESINGLIYKTELDCNFTTGTYDILFKDFYEVLQNIIWDTDISSPEVTSVSQRVVHVSTEVLKNIYHQKTEARQILKLILKSGNIILLTRLVGHLSHKTWETCGIHDSNFSFHTKRIILSKIYVKCILYTIFRAKSEDDVAEMTQKTIFSWVGNIKSFKAFASKVRNILPF